MLTLPAVNTKEIEIETGAVEHEAESPSAAGGEGSAGAETREDAEAETSVDPSVSPGSPFTGVAAAEGAADEDAEAGIFSAVGGAVEAPNITPVPGSMSNRAPASLTPTLTPLS